MKREHEINAQTIVGEMMPLALTYPKDVSDKMESLTQTQLMDIIEVTLVNFNTNDLPVNHISIKRKIAVLVQACLAMGKTDLKTKLDQVIP